MTERPPMGTTTKPQRLWRWLKRLGIGIGALLIGSLVVGVVYEQLARYRAARDYPPPGRLVDIGGRRDPYRLPWYGIAHRHLRERTRSDRVNRAGIECMT